MSGPILHIALDEKFINSANYQFEQAAPGRNSFYILVDEPDVPLKHVALRENIHVLKNDISSKKNLATSITAGSIVVFHSLNFHVYDLVLQLHPKVTTIWMCFGFEIYNDPLYTNENEVLAPITFQKFRDRSKISFKKALKAKARPLVRKWKKDLPLAPSEIKAEAIARIDYLCSSFQEEFDVISEKLGARKKSFDFWYYPLEQILDLKKHPVISSETSTHKNSIWIGNSGYRSGNHLDVFQQLKTKNLEAFDAIVVPLSYGNKPYIDAIMDEGSRVLGAKFKPLTNFVSLEKYNGMLQKADVAIFYNKRQQALGNILSLLWFGSAVYLSVENPIFQFLRRHKVVVFRYETDFVEQVTLERITLEQKEQNRKILWDIFNEDKLIHQLKEQLRVI